MVSLTLCNPESRVSGEAATSEAVSTEINFI